MSIADILTRLAGKISKVYDAGKQSAYDEFWDTITNKGERDMYQYVFFCWDSEYIRPNRKIVPTYFESGACVFNRCTNLKKVEADYFDFSQKQRGTSHSSGWYYMFYNCPNIEEIEDIGLSPQYSYGHTFNGCTKLHTIARIRVDEDTLFESTFGKCNALKNIVIEGVVGNNIDFRYSPLSKESIMGKPITEEEFMELSDDVKANNVFVHNGSYYYGGVVTALSAATSDKTLTLKKAAVSNAFRHYAKTLDVVGTISDTIGTENFDYVIAAGVYGEGVNVGEYILLHFDDVSVVLMKTGESIDVLSGLDEGQWELIEYGDGIEDEWGNLVASKSNWTINLV